MSSQLEVGDSSKAKGKEKASTIHDAVPVTPTASEDSDHLSPAMHYDELDKEAEEAVWFPKTGDRPPEELLERIVKLIHAKNGLRDRLITNLMAVCCQFRFYMFPSSPFQSIQYQQYLRNQGVQPATDLRYFTAEEVLSGIRTEPKTEEELVSVFGQELVDRNRAEMEEGNVLVKHFESLIRAIQADTLD